MSRRHHRPIQLGWQKKNSAVGGNQLRKITRLVKYLRDIKGTFTIKSILLTTLLGNQISVLEAPRNDFADTPTGYCWSSAFQATSLLVPRWILEIFRPSAQAHSKHNCRHEDVDQQYPTALQTLFGRLDAWLQARPIIPTVTNPVLSAEHFNRHWDQAKYENFCEKVH